MQDPEAASAELKRCVRDLKFKGALVNGFSQVGSPTPRFIMMRRNTGRSGQRSRGSACRSICIRAISCRAGARL